MSLAQLRQAKMRVVSLTLLALAGLDGCTYTMGTYVAPQRIANLRVGSTTAGESSRQLGRPSMTKINTDGTRSHIYTYHSQSSDALSAIPVANLFAGTDLSSQILELQFDNNGILANCTITASTGRVGAPVTALVGRMPDSTTESEARPCGSSASR